MSGIFHKEEVAKDFLDREMGRAGQKVTDWSEPGQSDRNHQLGNAEYGKMSLGRSVKA